MEGRLGTTARRYTAVTVDWQAVLLAILLVGVSVGAVALVPWLQSSAGGGLDQTDALEDRSAGEQAAGGVGWAMAEAAFAFGLLGVLFLVRRLPETLRDILKAAVKSGALLTAGALMLAHDRQFTTLAGLTVGSYVIYRGLDALDLYYLANNAIALVLAVLIAAVGGVRLGVPFVLVGLAGLSVYDHYFANKRSWMANLADSALRNRLPVLILVPSNWQLNWDRLCDKASDEDEDLWNLLYFGIGSADLALPAMLATAVVAYGSGMVVAGLPITVWGLLAGVAVAAFRLRWRLEHKGGGAGLPPIATGCAFGLAAGALISGVPLAVALGVAG